MNESVSLAKAAALLGDPARSLMLISMLDGRAHTPTELAADADISASTASEHLAKLLLGGLVKVVSQGRHRYYELSGPETAQILEGLIAVSALPELKRRHGPHVPADLRLARTCYDHLAGSLGVALAEALLNLKAIELSADSARITRQGRPIFDALAMNGGTHDDTRHRMACRTCLDWSERRSHLAGAFGKTVLMQLLSQKWIRRTEDSRAIRVTEHGAREFKRLLGIEQASDGAWQCRSQIPAV